LRLHLGLVGNLKQEKLLNQIGLNQKISLSCLPP